MFNIIIFIFENIIPIHINNVSARDSMEKIKRYSIGIGFIFIIYIPLILLYIYPKLPNSAIGWAIILFIGIPLAIALETLSEFILSDKIGKKISGNKYSGIRVLIALLIALFILGIFGFLSRYFMPHINKYFA